MKKILNFSYSNDVDEGKVDQAKLVAMINGSETRFHFKLDQMETNMKIFLFWGNLNCLSDSILNCK